ncbi:DUF4397 domain-containing protein [Halobaculum lipolyticum]|uniref:DUF4397 domain-containing protein n=1 Tax=Halobaculum lipolyticum TaxID=3032001 RepID=A0ABD5W968_9EURY
MRDKTTGRLAVALAAVLVGSVLVSGAALGSQALTPTPLQQQVQQEDGEPSTQETAYLRVLHASPDAPAVDVSLNNETVVSDLAFGEATEYVEVAGGEYNLTITTAEGGDVVFQENVSVAQRSVTTVAASGQVSEDAAEPFAPLFVNDDAFEPDEGEAAVAVAHLSPDAPAVDVTVEDSDVVVAEDLSYGVVGDYVTVPEGDYTLEIREASEDNNGTVVATVDVELDEESAYTAYAIGTLAGDNDSEPFGLALTPDATTDVTLPDDDTDVVEPETPEEDDEGNETETPEGEETETETPEGEETETETPEGDDEETETETPEGEETETPEGDDEETETETPEGDETETETPEGDDETTETETPAGDDETTETETPAGDDEETETPAEE